MEHVFLLIIALGIWGFLISNQVGGKLHGRLFLLTCMVVSCICLITIALSQIPKVTLEIASLGSLVVLFSEEAAYITAKSYMTKISGVKTSWYKRWYMTILGIAWIAAFILCLFINAGTWVFSLLFFHYRDIPNNTQLSFKMVKLKIM